MKKARKVPPPVTKCSMCGHCTAIRKHGHYCAGLPDTPIIETPELGVLDNCPLEDAPRKRRMSVEQEERMFDDIINEIGDP